MPFTQGELRRTVSSRRNAKTEAFRAGEGVKASRIQVKPNPPLFFRNTMINPSIAHLLPLGSTYPLNISDIRTAIVNF